MQRATDARLGYHDASLMQRSDLQRVGVVDGQLVEEGAYLGGEKVKIGSQTTFYY
jgi:hypothetical protein